MDFFRDIVIAAATQGGGAAPVAGYAAWPALIGAEMMVNGDCSSGTGWTLGAGVAIAVGKMTATASSDVAFNSGVAEETLIGGATYRCAFTIDTLSLGSARVQVGDSNGTSRSSTGTFSQDLTPSVPDGGWALQFTSATMQLDNFSVKSVGAMGVTGNWSCPDFDTVYFNETEPACIQFSDATEGQIGELTGAAKTSFDAAVSSSTACSISLTCGATGFEGTIFVSAKGGTPVAFTFADTGVPETVTHNVTSGAGSGFIMAAGSNTPNGQIVRIQIALP